ncbi:MAG: transcriptional regulator GcvA [Hyphomicrobiales bacterium]|nr:transcriptional regulator GcvA [Alphaproteobacteria bacterium]
MVSRLPSLIALRAFEAVSRHLSFTRAAVELNLTQTAVSHQIRSLEEQIGAKLFIRNRNSIQLTELAVEYYHSIQGALAEIAVATEQAKRFDRESTLTIASSQAFAMKVLFPRLDEFRRLHPEINIQTKAVLSYEGLTRHEYDAAIRYGTGNTWSGWMCERLTTEESFPVCSPRLLKVHRLKRPEDLMFHDAIRSASPVLRDEWPAWLALAKNPNLHFKNEIICDLIFFSLQAALNGLGVAMGRRSLVALDIASGRLVEPFKVRLATSSGFFLLSAPEKSKMAKVALFRNWLVNSLKDV